MQETLSGIRFSLGFGPPLWVLVSNVVQSTGCFHYCIRHAVLGIAQHVLNDATAFHPCEIMFHLAPNLCQLPVGSLLTLREFSSGWLFFSPGRFSSPPAHSPGIRYPCTRWPPAGRRSLPHRPSFCHASCRGTFGSGSQSASRGCGRRPRSCRNASSCARCKEGPVFQGFSASGAAARW